MTKKGNRFNRPVAFNRTKNDDIRILNYPKAQKNFSGFAKKSMLEKIDREEQLKLERKTGRGAVMPRDERSYHPQEELEATDPTVHSPTNKDKINEMRQQIEQKKTKNNLGPKIFY